MRDIDLDELWPVIHPQAPARPAAALAPEPAQPEAPANQIEIEVSDVPAQLAPPPISLAEATGKASAALRVARDPTPFVWGGIGFCAGVLAWHLVGFWGFLTSLVQHHEPVAVSAPSAPLAVTAARASTVATAGTAKAADPCVTLRIDRNTGDIQRDPCSAGALKDAGFVKRTDRLTQKPRMEDAAAWSDTTAVQQQNASRGAEIETGSINRIDPGSLSAADLNVHSDGQGINLQINPDN